MGGYPAKLVKEERAGEDVHVREKEAKIQHALEWSLEDVTKILQDKCLGRVRRPQVTVKTACMSKCPRPSAQAYAVYNFLALSPSSRPWHRMAAMSAAAPATLTPTRVLTLLRSLRPVSSFLSLATLSRNTDQMFGAPRGAFTTTQFKNVCRRKLGVNLSDADADHLFDRVDADGSGNVDFTEFISGFLPQGERRRHSQQP